MNSLKRKYMRMMLFIAFPLFILGCGKSDSIDSTSKITEDIKLNAGAVLKIEDSNYKLYDYKDGNFVKSSFKNPVISYDKATSSYIYVEGNKHYVYTKENTFAIEDESYTAIKLSPKAEYISYFTDNNGLKLKVFNTKDNKKIDIESNVSISGTLYDWYDSDTIVYYGVSDENVNGLFTYNIKENKEELLYKIDEGYLAFINADIDDILFLQLTLDNERKLMAINKETKETEVLTDKIYEIEDIVQCDGKYYFTGKMNGDNNSLYEINNGKIKRLIFDFPTVVLIKKGLTVDNDKNILFIGSNSGDMKDQAVYSYSSDGTVSIVSDKSSDYVFVDYIN